MIHELHLFWVSNFIALGIYLLSGTKFFWNEENDTCFNVECALLGRNFDVLGGYCSLSNGYYWLLLVTWWLLLVTGGYCSLPLVTDRSHFWMQIKSTLYFLFMLFQIKKLYLKCSLNSSLEKKWSAKISRSFTEYPYFSRLFLICTGLTLFRMVFFGAGHGWVGAFLPPSLKPVTLSYNDETWHSYTLPKEDPKNI